MVIEVPSLDRWAVLGGVLGNRKGECVSGTRLGSNSTPFVFFTDAFTGEFLCGREVGRETFQISIETT